jgi:hypothetical protein
MSKPDLDTRAFHEGRDSAWIPEELLDAMLRYDAGDPRPLAAYIRAHGVPRMLDNHIADLLMGKILPLRGPTGKAHAVSLRTQAILSFMRAVRLHRDQQLLQRVPRRKMRFPTVKAIQQYAAARFLGSADQWETIAKLERRHKDKD